MYAKFKISGKIEVVTGLHIGGSSAFSAIGAVDSPIVKDPLTGLPTLPGSSLKGKMRTLLAKEINQDIAKDPNADDLRILKLFGCSSDKKESKIIIGKLLFSDAVMCNLSDLEKKGLRNSTEVKFENTINRLTAVANPRQIERAVRGTEFPLEIIYDVGPEEIDEAAVLADMDLIKSGLTLLEYDYLGGSGTRGYGKVKFKDISVKKVIGNAPDEWAEKCEKVFSDFNSDR